MGSNSQLGKFKLATEVGAGVLFIELGGPWENGYIESFNG